MADRHLDTQLWGSTEGQDLKDLTLIRYVLRKVSKECIPIICKDRNVGCTGPLAIKTKEILTFQTSGNTKPKTQRHTPGNTAVTTPYLAQVDFSISRTTVSYTTVPRIETSVASSQTAHGRSPCL